MKVKNDIFKHIIFATTLFAFAFLTLIPKGFMPSVDETGQLSLVICSGSGATTINHNDQDSNSDPSDDTYSSCPYTTASSTFILAQTHFSAVKNIYVFNQDIPRQRLNNKDVKGATLSRAPPIFFLI